MIDLILHKIKNQKWLSFCLTLGFVLLVGVAACQPMFKNGAIDRLLQNMFVASVEDPDSPEYPTVLYRQGVFKGKEFKDINSLHDENEKNQKIWKKYLDDIDVLAVQSIYRTDDYLGNGCFAEKDNYLQICYTPEMTEHIKIINGISYDEYKDTDCIPCIMTERVMDRRNHVVGETIEFAGLTNKKNEPLKLKIVGIYTVADSEDFFWHDPPNVIDKEIFVSEEGINKIISEYGVGLINYEHYAMLDYTQIRSANIENVEYCVKEFAKSDSHFKFNFQKIINMYNDKKDSVAVMLFVLQMPILGMLLAFIYMVASQIVESESGEIAMFKSRGLSRFQVIKMYTAQLFILAILGLGLGIPLGYFLCKLCASTTNFLTFSFGDTYLYKFVLAMVPYSLIAIFVGIIFVLIPVIKHSKISIVEQKSNNSVVKKMFWQKYFLDIALLGVSIYLLYNYNKNIDDIRIRVIEGNNVDPVIFLNTCLFIIAFGLVVFRLVQYFVRFIYKVGKKKWKPVTYVAFLQITRTFKKQGFITVFMILTISLGLFNANTARTINKNNSDRIEYSVGTDVITSEYWNRVTYKDDKNEIKVRYIEPDYNKYYELVNEGICDNIARVIRYNKTNVEVGNAVLEDVKAFGIETDLFGKTARLKDDLNMDYHWYNYLNQLGENANGVIVSRNLADALNLEVGKYLTFYCTKADVVQPELKMLAQVVAIVDNFPGYDRYFYEDGVEKEKYFIVANYATMIQRMEITPYDVWYDLHEGKTVDAVMDYLESKSVKIMNHRSTSEEISNLQNSADIQVTNGMFTLSFIVAVILCGIGFLIYWVASIRKRELLFGVYRAMGISVKDINTMLIYEHIFSTFLSIVAGITVGLMTTFLFIRLTCVVYLPKKSNLSIYIYYEFMDMVKLFAMIAIMIVVCLLVLRKIIKKMNITQALKLGED